MTQCASLDLKKVAVLDTNPIPVLPRQFHERTGHILPIEANPLQEEVNSLRQFANDHGMQINEKKDQSNVI